MSALAASLSSRDVGVGVGTNVGVGGIGVGVRGTGEGTWGGTVSGAGRRSNPMISIPAPKDKINNVNNTGGLAIQVERLVLRLSKIFLSFIYFWVKLVGI
jgi:hypothetical protein